MAWISQRPSAAPDSPTSVITASRSIQDDTFNVAKSLFELDESKKLALERFVRTGYNGHTAIGGENSYLESDNALNLIDYKERCDPFHIGKVRQYAINL